MLRLRGINELYVHQAQAVGHALAGKNVVVITPTASGKTLCYNLPILHSILQNLSDRALYLFPTKALAQDQQAELQALCEPLVEATGGQIAAFTYDGDTPPDARRAIRTRARLVLSNPDMLHSGILPHHPRWAKLFENLCYVVLDELHAYRGVYGSHVCNVLRRLRRVCRHYGSDPIFICSSATIANPREIAERLAERPFELVEQSGAPRGEKLFIFVNPPVVNQQLGIRRSCLSETRRIAAEFLRRNLQLIVFAQRGARDPPRTSHSRSAASPGVCSEVPKRGGVAGPSRSRAAPAGTNRTEDEFGRKRSGQRAAAASFFAFADFLRLSDVCAPNFFVKRSTRPSVSISF